MIYPCVKGPFKRGAWYMITETKTKANSSNVFVLIWDLLPGVSNVVRKLRMVYRLKLEISFVTPKLL